MKRILTLVPPEDRAGRALKLARALAAERAVEVTLLRVLEPIPDASLPPEQEEEGGDAFGVGGAAAGPLRNVLEEAERAQVETLAESLRDQGVVTRTEVAWGVTWQQILERVVGEGYDLVVKPATGLTRGGSIFFGSTALHLFRRCPCPVWVVGNEAGLPARVIAAVDPTAGDRRLQGAHAVLDWANEVAGWSDDHPRIASAWRAIGTDIEGLEWDGAELERYRRFAKREAESRLLRIVEGRRESLPEDAIHLIEGHPAEALPAFTAGRTTDLIVMGTLTRPDAIGDMLGETAESVIRQVTCSVLTVPPGSHPDQDMRADDLRHAAGRVLLDVEGTE